MWGDKGSQHSDTRFLIKCNAILGGACRDLGNKFDLKAKKIAHVAQSMKRQEQDHQNCLLEAMVALGGWLF